MIIVILLFLLSLLGGQLTSWSVFPGVTIYLHDVVLILLIAVVGLRRELKRSTLSGPIALFSIVGMLSLVVGKLWLPWRDVALGSLYLVRWTFYAQLYDIVSGDKQHYGVWRIGLYIMGSLLAIVGLLQYVWYPDLRNLIYLGWDPHFYRIFSTFLDPNFAGILFVLGFLLGFTFWANQRIRLLLFVSQTILFTSILLTYSRSSYIAFLVGILTFMVIRKKTIAAVGLITVFIGAILLLPLRNVEILRFDRAETASARLGNWQRSFSLISGSPIFGYGFNTLRAVQRNRGWTNDSLQVSRAGAGVDNSFLFVLATTGSIGLGVYLWIFVVALKQSLLATSSFGSVVVASISAVGIHALFINSLFYPWVMIWIWILFGALQQTKTK